MQKLIVLTKKFGRNFTGATLSTQMLIKYWKSYFDRIEVMTLEIGEYERANNVYVTMYKSTREIQKELCNDKDGNTIYYSDDHLGYLFNKYDKKYVHTYHGNWPDAKAVSISFLLKSFYFMPLYKLTIRGASQVVNVSEYMEKYTKRYNNKSKIIRNGIDNKVQVDEVEYPKRCVLVGNVDKRKYKYVEKIAWSVYELDKEIVLDIYGKEVEKGISKRLRKIPNIELKGANSNIPYSSYRLFINASSIENLSISVVEALKSGVPVICFNIGGLSEVVIENKTGYVIAPFDTEKMARRIVGFLATDDRMSFDKAIYDEFAWDYAAKQYLTVFQSIDNCEV